MRKNNGYFTQVYPTILFAVLMFVFAVYVYYPGIITSDSVEQLTEAKTQLFLNVHAPGMAFLWYWLNYLYFGPVSLLVFNNLIFWLALCLFSFYLLPTSNFYRVLFVFLVGIFPPIFTQLGILLVDIPCCALLFLACTLLLFMEKVTRIWTRFFLISLTVLFLFYAVTLRHNAIIAIVPICFWVVKLFMPIKMRALKTKTLFFGVLLISLFFTANQLFTHSLVQERERYPSQMFKIQDLFGISIAKKSVMLPHYLIKKNNPTVNDLAKMYTPTWIYNGDGYLDFHKKNIQELDKFWMKTILQNPWAYMKNRLLIFACLAIGGSQYYSLAQTMHLTDCDLCEVKFYPNYLFRLYYKFANLFVFDLNFLQEIYNSYHPITKIKAHPVHLYILFLGGVYWLTCLFVSVVSYLTRKKLENFAGIFYISLSGFIYGAGYLFYAPTDEYRYWLWTVMASIISLAMLIKERVLILNKHIVS